MYGLVARRRKKRTAELLDFMQLADREKTADG